MARTAIINRAGEMIPTAVGGTLGVFTGMIADDAIRQMLSGKSQTVQIWAAFAIKLLLGGGMIIVSSNEQKAIREAGLAGGSAILGTTIYSLLTQLAIINV